MKDTECEWYPWGGPQCYQSSCSMVPFVQSDLPTHTCPYCDRPLIMMPAPMTAPQSPSDSGAVKRGLYWSVCTRAEVEESATELSLQVDALASQVANKDQRIGNLEATLKDLKSLYGGVTQQGLALAAKVAQLQGEADDVQRYIAVITAGGKRENALSAQLSTALAERDAMKAQVKSLYRAYVNTLENGRDRIIFLGGRCDSLEDMERGDPALIRARLALEAKPNSDHDAALAACVAALDASIVAIDDWLHTYAAAVCDIKRVREAYARISEKSGTIAYIAETQRVNRAALAQAKT